MILHQILLRIFERFYHERTISACFHLLKGKKSGQTIQDVGIFQLYPYFGLLPKLTRKRFDDYVVELIKQQYLVVYEDGQYELSTEALAITQQPLPYFFDGWHYRGNEHIFFARLALIVQSLSYQSANVRTFAPVQRDENVQQWVRQFLIAHNYTQNRLQQPLHDEMLHSLQSLQVEEQQITNLMNRLAGYSEPGLTWQQLSFMQKQTEIDVQLLFISTLHQWLNEIYNMQSRYPLLASIMQQIRVENTLTGSTTQTVDLFKQGHTLEQISQIRRLKMSTIEDHIVEFAMHDAHFDMAQFVEKEDQQAVLEAIEGYHTKKLRVLKEVVPHLSYFQIRLVIARGAL